jgi:hypothetical protein
MDMDVLKQLIEDPRLTIQFLAERLRCSHTTVETHRGELDKTWKYGVWYHMMFHRISSSTGLTLVWN